MKDSYIWPYEEVPDNWEKYDPEIDYCGPKGHWIARFIPRDIWGIDCNLCYYAHDMRYEYGTTEKDRKFADKAMLRDQNMAIKKAVAWWRPLRYAALISGLRRYHMVRWFGRKPFENKGN